MLLASWKAAVKFHVGHHHGEVHKMILVDPPH